MRPALIPALLLASAAVLWADAPRTPDDRAAYGALARDAERELRENILPFWLKHARDPDTGSFRAFIGEDMVVRDDQPHGALLTARILWTFSAAQRQHPDPAYLQMAQAARQDLMDRFVDREQGGVFWSARPDGRPEHTHKQIYLQAFAIYGLSEYSRATGDAAALAEAKTIYGLLDEHARDRQHGGYFDVLDRAWQPLGPDENILGPGPKSQNSHIHILEAFTNLLRVWPDETLRLRQRELIEILLTRLIDPKTNHLILFVRNDWTPVSEEVSYGHDIELSWLLVEAAEVAGDPTLLARARQAALAIAETTLAEGIDSDGGIYLEGDARGPTKFEKEWWEQAEGVVGFLNAYQLSGDPRFFVQAVKGWRFIQDHVVDRENGDWHNTLDRSRQPIREMTTRAGRRVPVAKLSVWKCPYHNSRACLQMMERLEALGR